MADRYWVGGSGNWNSTSKWSTTSGGSSGASVPTTSDDVYFDNNSDAGADFTVTLPNGTHSCRNFDATGLSTYNMVLYSYFVFLSGTGALNVAGPVGITGNSRLSFSGDNNLIYGQTLCYVQLTNTTGYNIDFGSIDISKLQLTINGTGSTYGLAADIDCPNIFLSSNVIFNTNNYNYSPPSTFSLSGNFSASGTVTLNLGSSTFDVGNFGTAATVTVNPGTSLIKTYRLNLNGKTVYDIQLRSGPSAGVSSQNSITGSVGCHDLTLVWTDATNKYITHSANDTVTVSGNITRTGGTNDLRLQPRTGTTVLTISKSSGYVGLDYVTLTRQTASGGATFYAGANSTDGGSNTGWIFTAPPSQTLTMPAISSVAALYAPTITPGSVTISPPFISSAEQLYGPTLTAGAITISLPLITNTSILYEPQLNHQLALPFISSTEQMYTPVLTAGAVTVQLPLIASSEQLFEPTITAGAVTISLPYISSGDQLYAPTISPGSVTITAPLIGSTETLYPPTITAGSVTITPPYLENSSQLYAPTLTAGAVTITTPLLTNTNSLFAPTISAGAVTISLPVISSSNQLYAPTISAGAVTLQLPQIASTNVLYGPTLLPQAVTISVPFIAVSNSLYGPVITAGVVTLQLPLIASANQLFSPTILPGSATIQLPIISSAGELYPPSIAYDQFLSLPFILSLAEAFAPRVYRMAEDPIDQGEDTIITLGVDNMLIAIESMEGTLTPVMVADDRIVLAVDDHVLAYQEAPDSNVMDNSNARY